MTEPEAPPATAEPGPPPTTVCPSCKATVAASDSFCESCGAALAGAPVAATAEPDPDAPPIELTARRPPPGPPRAPGVLVDVPDLDARPAACAACGGTVAPDGYCEQCGTPAPRPRDHFVEHPAAWVAVVCDRGRRHARNEDAGAVAAVAEPGAWAAAVVCDGVSSAPESDVASLAAARAARDVLAMPPTDPPTTADELLLRACAAANDAASRVAARVDGPNPPSCTFVAALVEAGRASVAWVGDSRAYWLPDGAEPRQLTVDHSWAALAMAEGASRAQAEALPQAHAITRWLGADGPDEPPGTVAEDVSAPGWLLVCSDGLWNYCSAPEDVAGLLRGAEERVGSDPVPLAEELVRWANEQGGHDNITAALVRCGGEAPAGPAPQP